MSPVNKRLVEVGISKQTAKGSPAAQPTFWFGVKDGKPAAWEISEDVIEVTSDSPLDSEADRTLVVPGAEHTSLVHPKMVGLLLYGALGAITTTGSGPFTHVITPAMDLPYLTVFGRAFGGDYLKTSDCKIDELELMWENAGHVSIKVTAMGITFAWGTTAFVPTNDESAGGTKLFRAAGGTYKLDPSSGVPVERNIVKASVKIANGLEGVPQSKLVTPGDVAPARKDVEVSMTLAPDDITDIRKALTGSGSGTAISNVPVYGSFEWFFAIDGSTDLKIESPRVQAKPEMPGAGASGGYLEVVLTGKALQPASGDGIKATLRNDVTVY